MRIVGLAAVLAALAPSLVSCSQTSPGHATGGNATDASPGDTGITSCMNDPLAQAYAPNMVQPGQSGFFKFQLVSVETTDAQGQYVQSPPASGVNRWTIKVLDGTGAPLKGVTFPPETVAPWPANWPVGVLPYMPHHGHPSSAHPVVTGNADGTYTIDEVYLFMTGLWQVTFHAQSGSQTDSAVFSFCIEN
jgi:hypothetical protein